MRAFLSPFGLAKAGLIVLLFGACSDWKGLYKDECHGEWVEPGADCPPLSRCGNDQLDPGEQCDDGNNAANDGCSSSCETESAAGGAPGSGGDPELGGDPGVGGDPIDGPACGNGTLENNEICDDGNTENDDSCLAGCSWASCGDGVPCRGVEECDDGNLLSGDECAQSCLSRTAGDFFWSGVDHTYTYHKEAVTFEEAYDVCAREGGYLWTATTAGETRTIERNMAPDGQEVWIGLQLQVGTYGWITGAGSTYRPWVDGEPSAEECVVQYALGTDLANFRTRACDELRPFICEHQAPHINSTTHYAYRRWFMKFTHEEAVEFCATEGGQLVALETEEERDYVVGSFPVPF